MQHGDEQELKEENRRLKEELQALREKKQKQQIYENLFHASPDIIIQVDTAYRIMILHIPDLPLERLDALIGTELFSVTPPEVHHLMRDALEKVFSLGETIQYESEAQTLGKYRYFLNYLSPLKDRNGRIDSAYFVSREVTEQKLAEQKQRESDKKLMALFDSSQHLHILMDKDKKILWYNRKATETAALLFGKALQTGAPMHEYLEGEYRESFNTNFEKALAGDVAIFPRHYILHEDQHFYLEMMMQCIFEDEENKKLIGISLVGIETTERRMNEAKLEKINKELIQQNQQLNQYSFVVSHNIRGPIVTLLGLINLFEQDRTDEAFRNEIVHHIKKSTLHLDNIILDLNMVLSQSDGREIAKTDVNLYRELQLALDLLKSQIDFAEAQIEVDFSAIDTLFSVRSYIQSIFLNLVSNALKYRKPDRPAHIEISSRRMDHATVLLKISDHGIGLNLEKHADALFGFYKRFHTHVDGKGLGLHLVKTQVDLLNGRIEVDSRLNEGTTFSIFLPLNE